MCVTFQFISFHRLCLSSSPSPFPPPPLRLHHLRHLLLPLLVSECADCGREKSKPIKINKSPPIFNYWWFECVDRFNLFGCFRLFAPLAAIALLLNVHLELRRVTFCRPSIFDLNSTIFHAQASEIWLISSRNAVWLLNHFLASIPCYSTRFHHLVHLVSVLWNSDGGGVLLGGQ